MSSSCKVTPSNCCSEFLIISTYITGRPYCAYPKHYSVKQGKCPSFNGTVDIFKNTKWMVSFWLLQNLVFNSGKLEIVLPITDVGHLLQEE